ncbi:MAG TPA: glycosyltransferase family 2 protein [Anaerolineaceae bacterium]|nr:glycosyltransferase family 2 protein [Anaerolineaceae bacterium]
MKNEPVVTIVTPSYNQASFLEQTILSVLSQDYPRIEYFVVDGGSTDGSLEIIQKYADRIDWWVSEKDSGQADAINKGLKRATGDIVAWLNSDDYYFENTIQQAVRALQENTTAAFVYGDVQVVNEKNEITNILRYGDWNLKDLMSFQIIGQPAVFMRRDALQSAGLLDTSYHFLLDHHLWLRLAMNAGIKHIPRLWAGEHYHAASKNKAHAADFGREAQRIVNWMETTPALAPLIKGNVRRVHAGAERLNAFYLFDAREYRASLRAYMRSLRLHPRTAAQDWYRILFAILAPLGIEKLKDAYLARRKKKFKSVVTPPVR